MKTRLFTLAFLSLTLPLRAADAAAVKPSIYEQRVAAVTRAPGFVALWDFVRREPDGAHRFTAHRPAGATNDFALDAMNYVREFWGEGREATDDDFPLLGRGPFGQAIRIRAETDKTFRPLLLVPRERFHGTGLDVKGPGQSVTIIAWVIREDGNHGIAGIWHEGTDLKHVAAAKKVERGMRQYALFAGLNHNGAVAGHISENGTSSFGDIYAHHKATTAEKITTVPVTASGDSLDRAWSAVGLVFDNTHGEATAYLNGKASELWVTDPKKNDKHLYNAWLQAELHRIPGLQPGEDVAFANDQYYAPPEGEPLSTRVLQSNDTERFELREYRYTRVRVTLRKDVAGRFTVAARELVAVRLNPWWFPYDLDAPGKPERGGPCTIGRVVYRGRSAGFIGYLGGVAVFDRALSAEEMVRLSGIGRGQPIFAP